MTEPKVTLTSTDSITCDCGRVHSFHDQQAWEKVAELKQCIEKLEDENKELRIYRVNGADDEEKAGHSMVFSPLGFILYLAANVIFTGLLFQIISWSSLIVGPIVALLAARPVYTDGPWMWEKTSND